MKFKQEEIPYSHIGFFNKIVTDYIAGAAALNPFYEHSVTVDGLRDSIENRKQYSTDRSTLVSYLNSQYSGVGLSNAVQENINSLLSDKTFTITTAHQNNIFTGPLYFIYKILHVIKTASWCKEKFPQYHFVPVYYMGSEDADMQELNHFTVAGEKRVWNTAQRGAVGRMIIDAHFTSLIDQIEGQLLVEPYGKEIISLVRTCYRNGLTVQQATFEFVHSLFGHYGLIVLIPDSAVLKRNIITLFKNELVQPVSAKLVEEAAHKLEQAGYKVQAHAREINLFYLINGLRERIVYEEGVWKVLNTDIIFSKDELEKELENNPERFSPNVILRGLFQETILPNIAFIGGGGELAYWLQLKFLFDYYKVPYPVLILRNSFLIIEKQWGKKIEKLPFTTQQFFTQSDTLVKEYTVQATGDKTSLAVQKKALAAVYDDMAMRAKEVDITLYAHTCSLKTAALKKLSALEQKMLRAEKRKFGDMAGQVSNVRSALFPNDNLQERVENMMLYYAKWGPLFIDSLLTASNTIEQQFMILEEQS